MEFDSIIFDLDGTLWDSVDSVRDSWNQTLRQYPQISKTLTTEDLQSVMGLVVEDLSQKLFGEAGERLALEIGIRCCAEENEYIRENGANVYPGLRETLEKLRKHHSLYIVSNCQEGYIESFFAVSGLQHLFTDYECSGSTGFRKDKNIALIVKRNHLQRPVYVGDTQGDLNAARAAGVRFLWASYGFGTVDDPLIRAVKDIRELPDVMDGKEIV